MPMTGRTLLTTVLAFLLAAASLGVTFMAYQYVQLTRKLGQVQFRMAQVEFQQNRIKVLGAEALNFSRKDSSIDPILFSAGLKQRPGAAQANPNR